MGSLDPVYLDGIKLPPDQILVLSTLGSFQGKYGAYGGVDPELLDDLRTLAKIESIESSNRLEGIVVDHGRLEEIALTPSSPKDRPESEVAGYRDALDLIHRAHGNIRLDMQTIKELHQMVYSYTPIRGGEWKERDNYILERVGDRTRIRFYPVKTKDTPEAMDNLMTEMEISISKGYGPLLTIPLFVLDFLCIHPFPDGNGRVARLITLLLLYKADYHVGRYISIERVMEQTKDEYYDTLLLSSQGWHERRHDPIPWITYFWMVLIKAHRELDDRITNLQKGRGSKTIAVRRAILSLEQPFSFAEVKELCPEVSDDMIRHVMKAMKKEGKIVATSKGKGARWVRTG